MPIDLTNWITSSLTAANRSLYFMVWNTFLALIPFVVSLWLFRGRGSGVRRFSWWLGFALFMAFLPNAPYVLTDIIHLVRVIREDTAIWTIAFVLVPQYMLFMLIGTEAYVLSLINMGHYLRQQGQERWIPAIELVVHALCAIGIYLGRFPRFNSWDILTEPGRLFRYLGHALVSPQPLTIMLLTFVGIATIYWPLKHISLALALYWRVKRREWSAIAQQSKRTA